MGDFHNLSPSIFDEPEYQDSLELLVAIYLMLNRDMAGVCPWNERGVAAKCKTSVNRLRRIIDRMEKLGKIKRGINGSQIWLKSGIYHTLYKGHHSKTQMSSVVDLLNKWNHSGVFGNKFAVDVVELYANKYNLAIPYILDKPTLSAESESETQSEIETKLLSEILINGQTYRLINLKIKTDKFEQLKKMYPEIDHNQELMMADLKAPDYQKKGKKNDIAFLTNWFKRAAESKKWSKNGKPNSNIKTPTAGNGELSKYDTY